MTTAQKRYKDRFDKKVRFRPVVQEGDQVHVERPPRDLRAAERRGRDGRELGTDDISVKVLPKTEGPFRARQAADTTVTVEQDRFPVRVSIDRVTRILQGLKDRTVPTAGTSTPSERIELP